VTFGEALLRTEPPPRMTTQGIHWPLPAFTLMLPKGLLVHPNEGDVKYIFVAKLENGRLYKDVFEDSSIPDPFPMRSIPPQERPIFIQTKTEIGVMPVTEMCHYSNLLPLTDWEISQYLRPPEEKLREYIVPWGPRSRWPLRMETSWNGPPVSWSMPCWPPPPGRKASFKGPVCAKERATTGNCGPRTTSEKCIKAGLNQPAGPTPAHARIGAAATFGTSRMGLGWPLTRSSGSNRCSSYTQRHKSLRVHFMCQSVILV
jgi:hypothetical protein